MTKNVDIDVRKKGTKNVTENVTKMSILGAIGQFVNNHLIGYNMHFGKATGLRIALQGPLYDYQSIRVAL